MDQVYVPKQHLAERKLLKKEKQSMNLLVFSRGNDIDGKNHCGASECYAMVVLKHL